MPTIYDYMNTQHNEPMPPVDVPIAYDPFEDLKAQADNPRERAILEVKRKRLTTMLKEALRQAGQEDLLKYSKLKVKRE